MELVQTRDDGRSELVRSWGDWSARILAAAAVIGMGAAAWNWSSSTMSEMKATQAEVVEHRSTLLRIENKIEPIAPLLTGLTATAEGVKGRLDRIERKQDADRAASVGNP